jgi:hypothetical protein
LTDCEECARKNSLLRLMLQAISRHAGGLVAELKRLAEEALGG